MLTIGQSLFICITAFVVLQVLSRGKGVLTGLSMAYLFALYLQHLPGAYVHWLRPQFFEENFSTRIGIHLTAIGSVAFVFGVAVVRWRALYQRRFIPAGPLQAVADPPFLRFCLLFGWLTVLAVTYVFANVPSIGAALSQAGNIWILAVLLGFLGTLQQRDLPGMLRWLAALAVYPLFILFRAGFLSFGSTSVIIVACVTIVSLKTSKAAWLGLLGFCTLCFFGFLSYYLQRTDFRESLSKNPTLAERAARVSRMVTDFGMFDPDNPKHMSALNERLNQNQFVGMTFRRIEVGQTKFVEWRSMKEGLQALIPRLIWPGKPTFGGNAALIKELAGFEIGEGTTFGPGQVLELYACFGTSSLVIGFFLFGLWYGWLDAKVLHALRSRDWTAALLWFPLAVAINQPLSTVAELAGNTAAAFVAALGWRWLWKQWSQTRGLAPPQTTSSTQLPRPYRGSKSPRPGSGQF